MRFVGRELELQALEDAYHKNDFQMAVIYGRRRIGKTTLLRQFCQGKKTVFFTAIKTTAKRNIDLFGKCALNALAPEIIKEKRGINTPFCCPVCIKTVICHFMK